MPDESGNRGDSRTEAPWRPGQVLAVTVLTVLAATATCTLVWNFDVFWHLASGRWPMF